MTPSRRKQSWTRHRSISSSRTKSRLRATVREIATLLPEAERLVEQQMAQVTWAQPPWFWASGRTAWSELDAPVVTNLPTVHHVRALKLKGVGLATVGRAAEPPPLGKFSHRRPHVGVTETGQLHMVWPERAPVGGIFLDRARLEFDNALRLSRLGCPSVVPVALFEYNELRCDWQQHRPVGAVLTASPNREPYRANLLFEADLDGDAPEAIAYRSLCGALGRSRLEAIETVGFEYGRTLRQFHEAGLFRHNANPDNLPYCTELSRIYLTDLDSSRLLSDCSTLRRPLEILRDVAGGIYNLAAVLVGPASIQWLSPYELAKTRLFDCFLEGYFQSDMIELERICEPVLEHVHHHYCDVIDRHRIGTPEDQAALPAMGLDQPFIFASLMSGLVGVFGQSRLSRTSPLDVHLPSLARQLATFPETLRETTSA